MAMMGTVLGVLGSVVSAAGTIAAGKAQQAAANYEAAQMEIKAKQERAAAQVEAEEHRRRRDLALSRLQAVSAASGFSGTDPTTLQLGEEITRRGTVQADLAQFGGDDRAEGLRASAVARRMTGAAAAKGATYSAFGSLISGIGGGLAKYNTGFDGGSTSYYYASPGGWQNTVTRFG